LWLENLRVLNWTQLKRKNKIILELSNIEWKIGFNSKLLTNYTDEPSQNLLNMVIRCFTQHRNEILQEQGKELTHKAKTRLWYNEVEKSKKYFLNMLKRVDIFNVFSFCRCTIGCHQRIFCSVSVKCNNK